MPCLTPSSNGWPLPADTQEPRWKSGTPALPEDQPERWAHRGEPLAGHPPRTRAPSGGRTASRRPFSRWTICRRSADAAPSMGAGGLPEMGLRLTLGSVLLVASLGLLTKARAGIPAAVLMGTPLAVLGAGWLVRARLARHTVVGSA